MPRKTSKQKAADDQWFADEEIWLDLFKWLFLEDDTYADKAARIFHRLLTELERGSDGVMNVRTALENARRVIFPYTRFAHECELRFRESLDSPEPLTLAGALLSKQPR